MVDFYEYSTPELVRLLGNRFKEYRIRCNLTQKDVSEQSGIGLTTIHKFENGTAGNISLSTFIVLLKVVGQINTIKCEIISVIARTLNVEESVITMEMAAGDIEQWDSMGNVAILTTIENELNVDFPVEDLFELNTVGSIVNKVIELKNV